MTCSLPSTLSADASAALLTAQLVSREPFWFLRWGDGALECLAGMAAHTCDGEVYTPELAAGLREVWGVASAHAERVLLGDWRSASFLATNQHTRYEEQYEALIADLPFRFVHFEALLLMRESAELVEFYRALREDSRRKAFLGPHACAGAARMLQADHVVTPMRDLLAHVDRLTQALLLGNYEVVIYGAGLAGNIPVARWWERTEHATAIHVGSAMDPLFRGVTRRQQLRMGPARELFQEML